MVVWGDLLFLINFSMDFLCFYVSCLILHRRMSTVRACVAALIGGAYSVAALFLTVKRPVAIILDVLVLILMCLTVYLERGTTALQMLRYALLYFLVSALLGGLMTALFSLFNRLKIFTDGLAVSEGVDVWIFALLAVLGSIFTLGGGRLLRPSAVRGTVTLHLRDGAGAVSLVALVDSGNLALEPISGRAVVFAELEACAPALPYELYRTLLEGCDVSAMPLSVASRVRLVPTKTVEGEALLPAIRFKSARAVLRKGEKELDVYVAFVRGRISDTCNAIISSEAIN